MPRDRPDEHRDSALTLPVGTHVKSFVVTILPSFNYSHNLIKPVLTRSFIAICTASSELTPADNVPSERNELTNMLKFAKIGIGNQFAMTAG